MGLRWQQRGEKDYPETDESGQFWSKMRFSRRSTMIDMDSRLRAARGIAKTETRAGVEVFQTWLCHVYDLNRRGHPDAPPPHGVGWLGRDR